MNVFVTGGTGQIGSRLVSALLKRGDAVAVLSRRRDAWQQVGQDVAVVAGDVTQPGEWQNAAAAADATINLAGAGIFDRRWNAAYKQVMRDTRILGTANVAMALARPDAVCKVLVNGSAIGYYGPHGDEELTEADPPGSDFMARLCVDWEDAARRAESAGVRVALIRTGVVLDERGGALKQLLLPFRLGVGGPVASGRQFLSWIHHADMVGIILLALDDADAAGPINGTAPNPATSKEFAKALGTALGRPAFVPTPGVALRLLLGEVAGAIATGQRVIPAKAQALGYRFRHPEIGEALRSIVTGAAT